ncbi:hypothetical protein D7B24_003755 [Verticillium nonalfalfae]|uniref:Uncharacterized protein n=1 Tax=Verticillium nonalfalfae TaxID=1051616 RepID=A0A3M9YFJ2_9PEZI|nr:uncharacterized protein D7B24_003755 [Verticillium nonalfalfae]RNJ58935.1 hypothetical protein D7B24_003755 [Verticillium nonalfalfae]
MRPFSSSSLTRKHLGFLPSPPLCRQCLRQFSTTPPLASGHNKWSKIKHRKGAADVQKTGLRAESSRMIALLSRLHGETSPQVGAALATAKKAGVPKHILEGAVARGQGRSASGASLEPLTIEIIMSPGVALIVDCETDSKGRSLQDLMLIAKRHKGRTGSSATFLFTRLGRVVFEPRDPAAPAETPAVTVDDILDEAIEAGAEDIETDDDGNIVIWTQPNMTTAVTQALGPSFGDRILSSEIIWAANEDTKVKVDTELDAQGLADLLAALQEQPEVQGIYANVARGSISDEDWQRIEDNLDM